MTLTVTLSVRDGMVFATDSRGTIGDPRQLTAQNDTVKKMYVVGTQTVLQMSGANETGYKIIDEILQTDNPQTLSSTTEVMDRARKLLRDRYNEWFTNMPIIEVPNSGIPVRPSLSFTIAGFDKKDDKNIHRIYSLNSFNGFAPLLFNTGMCLMGVPQYAIYLLHRLFSQEMSIEDAMALAAYVITETATQDGKVGGPVQLMSLKDSGSVVEFTAEQSLEIVNENKERSNKLKELFFSKEDAL
jgi:20S proteasome alpha/beta subunit